MLARATALIALLGGPAAAVAGESALAEIEAGWGDRFLEIRLGDAPAEPAPHADRAGATRERALRDARRAQEERRIDRCGDARHAAVYLRRERRADDAARVLRDVVDPPARRPHAQRVADDVTRAVDRIALERRVRRLERRASERSAARARRGLR